MTDHFDESIMIGTLEISGSEAIKFKKRTIAAFESNIASSILMSMICAPFSTCCLATDKASSYCSFKIILANAFEPVTLVLSPTFTKPTCGLMLHGSKPDSFIGGICFVADITQTPYKHSSDDLVS